MELYKLGRTIVLKHEKFMFSYTPADDIVKDEFKGKYRYMGGLQCEHEEGSEIFIHLEKLLSRIAETVIEVDDFIKM